jgi:hypothetical protein
MSRLTLSRFKRRLDLAAPGRSAYLGTGASADSPAGTAARAATGSSTRAAAVSAAGHSLIELLFVLTLLGLCFAAGGFALARGMGAVEARGAAQAWQAGAAWAQAGAVWQGDAGDLSFASGRLAVDTGTGNGGGDLGQAMPPVPVYANVVRWRQGEGAVVRFLGVSGSPNSAGSLFFRSLGAEYRVTVRLESGLTVRTRVTAVP